MIPVKWKHVFSSPQWHVRVSVWHFYTLSDSIVVFPVQIRMSYCWEAPTHKGLGDMLHSCHISAPEQQHSFSQQCFQMVTRLYIFPECWGFSSPCVRLLVCIPDPLVCLDVMQPSRVCLLPPASTPGLDLVLAHQLFPGTLYMLVSMRKCASYYDQAENVPAAVSMVPTCNSLVSAECVETHRSHSVLCWFIFCSTSWTCSCWTTSVVPLFLHWTLRLMPIYSSGLLIRSSMSVS